MKEAIVIGILFLIWIIKRVAIERKLNSYDMSKTDNQKLTLDVLNGVSVSERRRRCVNGYYDKSK